MSDDITDVSIILVNYNTALMTIEAINSIIEKTLNINYEIIVVDNASKDDSLIKLKEKYLEDIVIIENQCNEGFGKASNIGADIAKGKYVLFLNTDTLLINNAVMIMYDYISKHDTIGAIGGNLYDEKLQPCHSFSVMPSIFTFIFGMFFFWIKKNILGKPYGFNYLKKPIKVGYITGADLMIEKAVFVKAGMFDSEFFMYSEEAELQYRIKRLNKKIISLPQAKIIHYGGGSFKDEDKMIIENREIMMKKSQFLMFEKIYSMSYSRIAYILLQSIYTLLAIFKKEYKTKKSYVNKGYNEYLQLIMKRNVTRR